MTQFVDTAADCVTVARWSATTIVAVRSPPEFGAAVMLISPEPVPLVGDNDSHPSSVAAVHLHSGSFAATVRVDALPLVAMVCAAGLNVKRQVARCETRARSSLTAMVPSRAEDPSLAATRKDTLPLP